jgi:cytochrome c peroxidase
MIMRATFKQRQVVTLFAWTLWCLITSTLNANSRKSTSHAARSTKLNGIGQPHRVAYQAHHSVNQLRDSASVIHRRFALFLLASLAAPVTAYGEVVAKPEFQLTDTCPASFELQEGGCVLRNRYREYRSLRDAGVGGLKTGLPPLREGFTPRQIDLGRYLFFDPILSRDGSVSCASCHDPALGFADGRALAVGIDGQALTRSAPSLWNIGFFSTLLWDGSKSSLEEQMQGPLYSPVEMGNSPSKLLDALNRNHTYRALFEQAFGATPIALDQIYTAITAFESSLISLNSRYDLYAHGYHAALNEEEIAGLNVFRSFVARCAECHTPPLFSNQQLAVLGVADAPGELIDPGAEAITGDVSQRGAFRVPSLRNITRTAPYMHRGQKATLEDAARFYTGGRGHEVPEGESLMIHWHIWEPRLTDREIQLLAIFMGALTDEAFMPEIPIAVPSGLPITHGRKFVSGNDVGFGAQ